MRALKNGRGRRFAKGWALCLPALFALLASLFPGSSLPADADTHYFYGELKDGQINAVGNRYRDALNGVFVDGADTNTKRNLFGGTNCIVLAECTPEENWKDPWTGMQYTEFKVLERLYGKAEELIRVYDAEYYRGGDVAVLFLSRSFFQASPAVRYTSVNKEFRLTLMEPGTEGPFVYTGKTDYGWNSVTKIRRDVKLYSNAGLIDSYKEFYAYDETTDIREAAAHADAIQLVRILDTELRGDFSSYYSLRVLATVKGGEFENTGMRLSLYLREGSDYYLLLKERRSPSGEAPDFDPFAVHFIAVPYDSPDGEYIRSRYGGAEAD